MWKAAGGLPHLQETLPLFLTEVEKGRLSLERLVEATAAVPAATFGIDHRKGAIEVGRDADIVAVDLGARTTIEPENMLSKAAWTAFAGREVRGLPVLTLVRGRVVYRDGVITGPAGWGEMVRRR